MSVTPEIAEPTAPEPVDGCRPGVRPGFGRNRRTPRLPPSRPPAGFAYDGCRLVRRLDELPVPAGRVVADAGLSVAGKDPRRIPGAWPYDVLTAEFSERSAPCVRRATSAA